MALQRYYPSTGVRQHQYLLKDHLGSIHTVTNEASQIVTRMHFGAFGQRQDVDWVTPMTAFQYAPLNDITTRGFTGHEHVDDTGVIHMNGRIYDPLLGRFLQADPVVQAPKNAQNLNRYSYVVNNPLSYTDPSGYSFGSFIGRLVGKYWKTFMVAVISYATYGSASNWAANWGVSAFAAGTAGNWAFAGAVAGAVGGVAMTGTLEGAFWGAVSGAALGAIGGTKALSNTEKVLAAGSTNGVISELQGGKFGHGFVSAGAGMWSGMKFGGEIGAGNFLASVTVAGTVSELTGGKFANGAVSAAMSYAFASLAQRERDEGRPLTENETVEAKEAYGDLITDYESVRVFDRKWMPFQGRYVAMAPDGNIYWPAAGHCQDLTQCTITYPSGYERNTLDIFIHEMGHVMQHQQGVNVVLRALPHQVWSGITFGRYNPYMSRSQYSQTPSPQGLNVEAQADWYMHRYCTQTGNC